MVNGGTKKTTLNRMPDLKPLKSISNQFDKLLEAQKKGRLDMSNEGGTSLSPQNMKSQPGTSNLRSQTGTSKWDTMEKRKCGNCGKMVYVATSKDGNMGYLADRSETGAIIIHARDTGTCVGSKPVGPVTPEKEPPSIFVGDKPRHHFSLKKAFAVYQQAKEKGMDHEAAAALAIIHGKTKPPPSERPEISKVISQLKKEGDQI